MLLWHQWNCYVGSSEMKVEISLKGSATLGHGFTEEVFVKGGGGGGCTATPTFTHHAQKVPAVQSFRLYA